MTLFMTVITTGGDISQIDITQIARPPRAKKRIALARTRKLFFKKKYLTHIAILLLFIYF